ncbi:MAG: DUF2125 domain-containing protein [Rhodobacteraceae bacterium]|nr:DUF2125 domain-containing protein [Paracoccaceae bacterium]
MRVYFKRGMVAAVLLTTTAQFAAAGVTAQDVWADWKGYMSSVGYDVTGNESQSGDTLTISDMTLSVTMPKIDGAITFTMNSLVFVGNGDGTVTVNMPSIMPVHISGKDGGEEMDVTVNYTQSGHSLNVSGDPGDINYDYSASQVGISLAAFNFEGQAMPPEMARFAMTLTNIKTKSNIKTGDVREYSQTVSIDSLTYDAAFDDPDSDDNGTFTGSLVDLTLVGKGVIPPNIDSDDFAAILDAGFAFDGTFEFASGNSSANAVGDGENFTMTTSSQGGHLGVAMSRQHLAYDFGQKGISVNVTTNQLPFPVLAEMSEIGFKIDMPIDVSDQEQEFAMAVRLGDFTTSDMIWGLFDPGAVLPRDPASLILDLTGKVKVLANLMDPEVIENLTGPPGEIHALTIKQILVSAAGAKLTGTGDFTFNNADLETFGGMPAPAGVMDLQLNGANGVMDKLIQMGLMAEAEAMPARMMMGLLAVPGEGEDSLVSKIEIGEDGSISANGQRIK